MLGKFIAAVAGTSAKMATDRQQAVALPSANLSLGVLSAPSGSPAPNFLTSAVSTMMTGVTNAMAVSSGALAQVSQKEATIDIGGQYWWRPTPPSYTTNELYMDVVETINCIVDEGGTILDADVTGDISVISRLSGPCPHALLTVRNPHLFSNGKVKFHPCVDVERWHEEQKMSFVPADGQYSLCTYYIPILADPSTRLLPLQLDLKAAPCPPICYSLMGISHRFHLIEVAAI
ncbi:AP-3 complex subunit mu, putative [Perkinsus marinus ATCC 50983]|uniref:AP-3 complex subunit mu, putative n=1 Tax=Perkinsus marinus (strain ATCC 50983 / TXsc) TaxID=423536 RepID=C5K821_PERM5|nr:AP-3 complex subunit mu, putative [Perkinsus marinus ATCC 50983]EER19706.1 AP-3 complex subunit mu, putative [Perkinsus marinus ATCC 50983]|eukprot:XP_002787910.1 AP-3 complex subunit mu, putative [Perkinsus marinus ATCC 50983]